MDWSRPLLCIFLLFTSQFKFNEKIGNCLVWIRTWGHRMVGADGYTEPWRPPRLIIFNRGKPHSEYCFLNFCFYNTYNVRTKSRMCGVKLFTPNQTYVSGILYQGCVSRLCIKVVYQGCVSRLCIKVLYQGSVSRFCIKVVYQGCCIKDAVSRLCGVKLFTPNQTYVMLYLTGLLGHWFEYKVKWPLPILLILLIY